MKNLKLNKETISRLNSDEMNGMGASGQNVCYTVARTCICFVERTGMIACGFENPKTMPCKILTWDTYTNVWNIQTETLREHGTPETWAH